MSETPFDMIIVGGGFAGLSAASGIVRQDHTTLLLDSQKYRNMKSKVHTIATWDHRDPNEFRAKGRKDLERYGTVTYEHAEVDYVKQDGKLFKVTAGDRTWSGSKLILAMGVDDIPLEITGYDDCWVSGIFHCLYCHGWEERGTESSGVLAVNDIANSLYALNFARQGLQLSKSVTMYTNGNTQLADEIEAAIKEAGVPAPLYVNSKKITKFVKGENRADVIVHLEDGTSKTEGFLAYKPTARIRGTDRKDGTEKGDLVGQLGLEIEYGVVKVYPPFNQTSVRGVFAAGDMATMTQTASAALAAGTLTSAGAPLQLQAELLNQKGII